MATHLQQLLLGGSPYDGFPSDRFEPDLQGWGSDHPMLRQLVERLCPELIIEVGSWKGRSALNMARYARNASVRTEILCIDTWLGSPEHWLKRDKPHFFPSLRLEYGSPTIYNTFLTNVVAAGGQDVITPFRVPSETAYFVLKKLHVRAKLIYVDAGHEYSSVARDLKLFWNLLTDDGVLCGDDYLTWPGVTRAVDGFRERHPDLQFLARDDRFAIGRVLPKLGP